MALPNEAHNVISNERFQPISVAARVTRFSAENACIEAAEGDQMAEELDGC